MGNIDGRSRDAHSSCLLTKWHEPFTHAARRHLLAGCASQPSSLVHCPVHEMPGEYSPRNTRSQRSLGVSIHTVACWLRHALASHKMHDIMTLPTIMTPNSRAQKRQTMVANDTCGSFVRREARNAASRQSPMSARHNGHVERAQRTRHSRHMSWLQCVRSISSRSQRQTQHSGAIAEGWCSLEPKFTLGIAQCPSRQDDGLVLGHSRQLHVGQRRRGGEQRGKLLRLNSLTT